MTRSYQLGLAISERGLRYEAAYLAYLAHLRAQGLEVAEIPRGSVDATIVQILVAVQRGPPVIAQAALHMPGYGDVLRQVEAPSRFGAWSYEPYDTKLAKESKAGAVL